MGSSPQPAATDFAAFRRSTHTEESDVIDHVNLNITDPARSRHFYDAALAPLGYALLMEIPKEFTHGVVVLGYGVAPKADLWLTEGKPGEPRTHVALRAETRDQVDAFHRAALAAGGTDNGAPGPRPHYQKTYYGAFILDLDGHNIEAMCHAP